MNIRDMHLEVNQSLQKVAANKTRKYLSEEIDWILNKMLHRFIQSRLRPKKGGAFTIDQVDLDSIRPLLKQTVESAYIDNSIRYKTYLPVDYMYLISDASYVSNRCGITTDPTVLNATLYLTWLKQTYTNKVNSPFYQTISMVVDGTNTFNVPADLPYSQVYLGYQRKEDITFVMPAIIHYFNQSLQDIRVGFERYGEWYKPQQILLLSNNHQITGDITYDSINATLVDNITVNRTQHQALPKESLESNRLESSETIPQILDVAFYKPSYYSPVSELIGNVLYTYRDDNFTVNRTALTYIRKPQIMSLALGTDCDLAPEFHQTICDLAVEYIKGRIENAQGLQIAERDIEKRVIL